MGVFSSSSDSVVYTTFPVVADTVVTHTVPVSEPITRQLLVASTTVVSPPVQSNQFTKLSNSTGISHDEWNAFKQYTDSRFVGMVRYVQLMQQQQSRDVRINRLEKQLFSFMDDASSDFIEVRESVVVNPATVSSTTLVAPIFSGAIGSNLALGTNWLTGDGGNEGIYIDGAGRVSIGTSSSIALLTIAGDLALAGSLRDATASAGASGMILQSTGTSTRWVATSSLGISGGGSGTVSSIAATVPTGFTISGSPITTTGTLAIDYAAGYEGILTASSTNWNTYYNAPSARITAGTNLFWTGNTLSVSTTSLNIAIADTTGTLAATRGGTGLSTITTNQLLIGGAGNSWSQIATSSLGLSSAFTTSEQLAALLSDETGSAGGGLAVFSNGPTFTGTATFASTTNSGRLSVVGTSTLATTTITRLTLSEVLDVSSGGTGLVTYSSGDLLYASGADTLASRAIGTTGQVLQVVSGLPTWVATSSLGISGGGASTFLGLTDTPSVYTANAIPFATSTANQLLFSNKLQFNGQHLGVGGATFIAFSTASSTTGTSLTLDGFVGSDSTSNRSTEILMRSAGNSITTTAGRIAHYNTSFTTTDDRASQITLSREDTNNTTPNGFIGFSTVSVGVFAERLRLTSAGNLGLLDTTPEFGIESLATSTLGYFGITNITDGDIFAIHSNGNVGIGTSTPGTKLTVTGTITATNLLGGATNLSVDANGAIIRDPSDERLKTNVQEISGALEMVLALRGVRYEWLDTERFGTQSEVGFLAQEVDLVVPEVVQKGGDYWSLNTKNLVAVVVEAIQEIWQTISGHEDRLTDLENENALLRERLEAIENQFEAPSPATEETSNETSEPSDTNTTELNTTENAEAAVGIEPVVTENSQEPSTIATTEG
jgi:hypothetical protein